VLNRCGKGLIRGPGESLRYSGPAQSVTLPEEKKGGKKRVDSIKKIGKDEKISILPLQWEQFERRTRMAA